ncbi:hypothetical protein GQX74_007150 [Glossina fuscipes]|nr:hypothetical protein GQX74_007150 [Glossina fuscipes]
MDNLRDKFDLHTHSNSQKICILLRDSDDFLSYHPISGHVNYIVLLSLVCAVCVKLLRSSTQLTWAIVKDTTTHEKEGKLQPIKTFCLHAKHLDIVRTTVEIIKLNRKEAYNGRN